MKPFYIKKKTVKVWLITQSSLHLYHNGNELIVMVPSL